MTPLFLTAYAIGGLFTWGGYEWRMRKSESEAEPIIEITSGEAVMMVILMAFFWPMVWLVYAVTAITDFRGR